MSAPLLVLATLLAAPLQDEPVPEENEPPELSTEQLRTAGRVVGLEFTDAELELMLDDAVENLNSYRNLWDHPLDNATSPVLGFRGRLPSTRAGSRCRSGGYRR